jgi:hypothetical protein
VRRQGSQIRSFRPESLVLPLPHHPRRKVDLPAKPAKHSVRFDREAVRNPGLVQKKGLLDRFQKLDHPA